MSPKERNYANRVRKMIDDLIDNAIPTYETRPNFVHTLNEDELRALFECQRIGAGMIKTLMSSLHISGIPATYDAGARVLRMEVDIDEAALNITQAKALVSVQQACAWRRGRRFSSLPPYQQRVVAESNDLFKRIGELTRFVHGPTFYSLDVDEQARMKRQLEVMQELENILASRIKYFLDEVAT